MASVTPAAGEIGFQPASPGGVTNFNGQPFRTQGAPSHQAEAPRIERLGPVRILRGGTGWRGIALRLTGAEGEEARFQLALTAGDGRSVTIAVLDEDEAVATWRYLDWKEPGDKVDKLTVNGPQLAVAFIW